MSTVSGYGSPKIVVDGGYHQVKGAIYGTPAHHDQWITCWWMRGDLWVMNLCFVSWEVIHMTSKAIRGLVPNLSGDNRCILSSHLPCFFSLPPPWETTHQKHGHVSVWSWTRSQPNCTLSVCMCEFSPADVHQKDKGRQAAAQPSLVPERSSIRTRSDPGGRM